MADASRLKGPRRPELGTPPPPEEARTDLAPAPEVPEAPARLTHAADSGASAVGRVDGRTLRRSGRTVQFATRVSPAFDERVRRIAVRDGLLLVEVLERALDAYEGNHEIEGR